MRGRILKTQLHPSFNRKFRSPFNSVASWQIEECNRALQCFLPLLFRPLRFVGRHLPLLQPDLVKTAFGHLKRFAAFHLGHVEYKTKAEFISAAKQAHDELLSYAKLMEQVS